MKVSLYKILEVKQALESLDLLAIPVVEDNDIDLLVSMIIVGLADRTDKFDELLTAISDEPKLWSENLEEAKEVLHNFFTLIPSELSVLINQLRSVSSTLENVVTQMMRSEMSPEENMAIPEQEAKLTNSETP